jgi:hypothetical protein
VPIKEYPGQNESSISNAMMPRTKWRKLHYKKELGPKRWVNLKAASSPHIRSENLAFLVVQARLLKKYIIN